MSLMISVLDLHEVTYYTAAAIHVVASMTCFAGSPCLMTISFARNLATFLPRPAESRNNFTSKTGIPEFALLKEGGAFAGTALGGIYACCTIDFACCPLLNTLCLPAQPLTA